MARYDDGFGVSFNDNDGGAAWFATPEGMDGYARYARLMGRWRARIHFLRMCWGAFGKIERLGRLGSLPRWRRLRGWKP